MSFNCVVVDSINNISYNNINVQKYYELAFNAILNSFHTLCERNTTHCAIH